MQLPRCQECKDNESIVDMRGPAGIMKTLLAAGHGNRAEAATLRVARESVIGKEPYDNLDCRRQ
jgi:hypothetical protein